MFILAVEEVGRMITMRLLYFESRRESSDFFQYFSFPLSLLSFGFHSEEIAIFSHLPLCFLCDALTVVVGGAVVVGDGVAGT
jgi:hypothetical protein